MTDTPAPSVLIPALNVVIPVIVATFTIFGASHLLTIPLLFIYQPKTIDKAMGFTRRGFAVNSS